MDKSKKNAKQKGLKSVFLYNDNNESKVSIVSFREDQKKDIWGDDVKFSHIEKISSINGEKDYLYEPKMFKSIKTNEREIEIKQLKPLKTDKDEIEQDTFIISNPGYNFKNRDYIGLKDILEEKYFGKSYDNDTIRIQIIYNFLDIKKILGLYISKIIFSLGNVIDGKNPEYDFSKVDFIGNMRVNENLEGFLKETKKLEDDFKRGYLKNPTKLERNKNFYNMLKSELFDDKKSKNSLFRKLDYFFPGVFEFRKFENKDRNQKGDNEGILNEKLKNNYDSFRLLSFVRQLVEHQKLYLDLNNKTNIKNFDYEDLFFNAKNLFQELQFHEILNKKVEVAVNELNCGLSENLKNNLYILKEYYGLDDITELTKKYYNFIVEKNNKNIGINARRIRENIIKNHMQSFLSQDWDNCRQKIYMLIDFCLYEHLKENMEIIEKVKDSLRLVSNSDEEKEKVYVDAAREIYESNKLDFKKMKNILEISKENKFSDKVQYDLKKCVKKADDLLNSCFSKLIYFLTLFMDNKDINIFLDTLINKYDAIADLVDCIKYSDSLGNISFNEKYFGFKSNFRDLSNDLRLIKNIGKMKSKSDDYEGDLFKDALLMLGVDENTVNDNWVEIYKRIFEVEKNKKNIRNFIINNVIKSRWFIYLSKSYNPKLCRSLIKNKYILDFVFKELPDTQIDRYFELVKNYSKQSGEDKRSCLINLLMNFDFGDIMNRVEKLSSKEKTNQAIGSKAETLKKVVTLYLTVLYLIVKGISDVNSRFVIAFSCYDRDSTIIIGDEKNNSSYTDLTKYFLDNDKKIQEQYYQSRNQIRDDATLSKYEKQKKYDEIQHKFGMLHYNKKIDIISQNLDKALSCFSRKYKYFDKNANVEKPKTAEIFSYFRNGVAHYNVLANMSEYMEQPEFKTIKFKSFYSIYRYLLQFYIYNELEKSIKNYNRETDILFKDNIDKYYSDFKTNADTQKKLQWILNIPFAYNLARYKNLSIEDLFNERNNRQTK